MNLSFLAICSTTRLKRDELTNASHAGWKGKNATASFLTIYFSQIYYRVTKYSWGTFPFLQLKGAETSAAVWTIVT